MTCKNSEAAGKKAATLVSEQIIRKPDSVLGLATGSTMISVYQELIKDRQLNNTDWSKITTFNLDEYVGLKGTGSDSYRYFMDARLFTKVNVDQDKTFVPLGAGDMINEPFRYEQLITRHGGIDLQLLGIGVNGHIGFNEPGSAFDSRTRIVALSDSTINANKGNFSDPAKMPTKAITVGLGTIMSAKRIVLVATGENKADAIFGLLKGQKGEALPCTVLRNHHDVTVIVDKKAASKLNIGLMGRLTKHVTYDF